MTSGETRQRGDLPAPLAVFSRLLDVLAGVTIALAGTALVALVVMMGWLVFGRYVLNDTPTWIERGATLAILAIAMPVAAVGVRERFHLSVPLLGISQGWTYAPMVLGGALITLFAVEQVLRDIFVPEAPEKRGPAAAFLE